MGSGEHGSGERGLAPGCLLVATPQLTEDTFARTVILLLQHGAESGALGVVVNRPTDTGMGEVLERWGELAADPAVVFRGGPVQPQAAICLGTVAAPGADLPVPVIAAVPGAPGLVTVDLGADPDDVRAVVRQVRVFAGYAGWSPGQLEDEVERGGWWVLDALPGDAFSPTPARLWRQVLSRQGMPLALVASYPPDPALN